MTVVYPSQTTRPAPGHSLNIRSFTPGVLLFTFCFIMRYIIHISVSVLFHVFHSVYLSFPQYKYRYVLTLKSYNNGYTRSVYKCKWSFK